MRLPLAADLHINQFAGAGITERESGIINGVVEKRGNTAYVTQRPSIDVFDDASTNVSDARGRAIYHWAEADDLYLLNNDTIYKNSHGTIVSTTPTAGMKKCKFVEIGGVLVLLDSENNQGFQITTGDVVTEITDVDFPPKQTPAIPLAHGGAVLDGYLFVLGTNGYIYNSGLGDPTTWAALDFLEAERDPDGGQYLGKHHDNVVAYGVKTIEFFYDAANATGSPLTRRQDVSHQIGCANGESVWEEGDRSFFLGNDFSGALHVYTLENFQVRPVSTSTVDSFLNQAIVKDGYTATGSGFTAQGHTYYILSLYLTPSDIEIAISIVYDATTGLWGEWRTTVNGLTKFPLMDWSTRNGTTARYGEGILANGDMITINDNMSPQDTLLASTYVTTGYVAAGYVLIAGETGTPISLSIRLGQTDFGLSNIKTAASARAVHNKTVATQTLTLKTAKENNSSFSSGVTTDTSKRQKFTRLGSFERINLDLTYAGTEAIRLEALDFDVKGGRS